MRSVLVLVLAAAAVACGRASNQSPAPTPAAGPLSGILRDAGTGRPLACADVSLRSSTGRSVLASTNRQGRFYAEVPQLGTYQVTLLTPGWVPVNAGTVVLEPNAPSSAALDVTIPTTVPQERRVPVFIGFSGVTRGLRSADDGPWILSPTVTMHQPRGEPTLEIRANAPVRGTFVQFLADSSGSPEFPTAVFEAEADRFIRQPILQALTRLKFYSAPGKTSECLLVRMPIGIIAP